MKSFLFILCCVLLFSLCIITSCSFDDKDVYQPQQDPTFPMRIEVRNFNNPEQMIPGANITIELTKPYNILQGVTDSNGYYFPEEFTPQKMRLTVEHPDYFSYHDYELFSVGYTDTVFPLFLGEYIEPVATFTLSDMVTDLTAITYNDGTFWLSATYYFPKIMGYYTEFQTELPDTTYPHRFQGTAQGYMWDPTDTLLTTNYGDYHPSPYIEYYSYLIRHDENNFGIKDTYELPYHLGIFAEDLTWFNDDSFWACTTFNQSINHEAFIFNTPILPDSSSWENHAIYSFPLLKDINGLEYDGSSNLWGCNEFGWIFRIPIEMGNTLDEPDMLYNIKNHKLYDITTDGNGNYWILAYSQVTGKEVIIKLNFEN